MRTYLIVVDPDAEGGFTVTVPSLPGCITQGETLEECVTNAQEAIALYIEDLVASGEPVPEERPPNPHRPTPGHGRPPRGLGSGPVRDFRESEFDSGPGKLVA